VILTQRSRWPQYHIWLLEKLRGLHKAFSHRVRFLETTEHALDGIPRGLTALPQFTVGDLSLSSSDKSTYFRFLVNQNR
jgi:hypothetical protein